MIPILLKTHEMTEVLVYSAKKGSDSYLRPRDGIGGGYLLMMSGAMQCGEDGAIFTSTWCEISPEGTISIPCRG